MVHLVGMRWRGSCWGMTFLDGLPMMSSERLFV